MLWSRIQSDNRYKVAARVADMAQEIPGAWSHAVVQKMQQIGVTPFFVLEPDWSSMTKGQYKYKLHRYKTEVLYPATMRMEENWWSKADDVLPIWTLPVAWSWKTLREMHGNFG